LVDCLVYGRNRVRGVGEGDGVDDLMKIFAETRSIYFLWCDASVVRGLLWLSIKRNGEEDRLVVGCMVV
jgi:hypothetical protein